MYWNFGGNFKPVARACQYSEWTKCFTSFIRYIWFEVVTDVADSLANEEVLWKVLAILLTFTTIAYFVYWKSQWKKEVKKNRERFVAVNHKIQDLELKVDIITYKTQYGIWPLQYLQEKNTLASLKNFQIGLPKFTLENSWIKNILSRANEKKYFLDKYSGMQKNIVQKCFGIDDPDFPISDCDNKLQDRYRPTTDAKNDDIFNHNSRCQNRVKSNLDDLRYADASRMNSFIVPPESDLNDRSKNRILYIKENVGVHNNNSPRRKSLTLGNAALRRKKTTGNQQLKIVSSATNMAVYSKDFSEFQGKIPNIPSKNNQFLSKSHNTLLDVKERLETLYKTIHNFTTNNTLVPMLELDSDSKCVRTSDEVSCAINDSIENTCALEDSNEFPKNITENGVEYSNSATAATCELNFSDALASANNGTEKRCDQPSIFNPQNGKNAEDFDNQKNEMDTRHRVTELHSVKPTDSESTLEDKTEDFQTVQPLDDLTSALLQEALKFKKQILSKVDLQDNGIDVKEECTSNCTETNSESSLKQSNMTFESKILDMITEESSSCTERKGDFYDYKIVEKNKILRDRTMPQNEKTKRPCLKNTSSNFEALVDEKVKKQKDLNCLSKVNKSFNGESSSNRIFPSSFSTVFLCNDQDSSNPCKSTHDNDTTVETKSSQDLISLTGSSSDVSVNRLISKLIENERKFKKPNQLTESEKTAMNVSTHNSKNSNDVKLTDPPIELTHPTVNCDGPVVHQSQSKVVIDEDTEYNDKFKEDTSGMIRLKEIKVVSKKLNDSVLDIKDNEEHISSEIKTHSNSFSQCSSIPKITFQNSEIKEIEELFLKSKTNPPIEKHDIYSGSSANEKLIKSKLSGAKQDDTLQTFKESDETLDSISFSNAQKLACNNWKPSRAKSNLDLTAVDKRQLKLTHRRSKSYVNPRGLTDEHQCNAEKEDFLESSSTSSQLSTIKVFDKEGNLNNVVEIKRNRSSESVCSTSSSIPISKSILLRDGPITLKKDHSSPVLTDINKKNCVRKESSLELIPLIRYSSSKSCIPVMNSRMATRKNLGESLLCNPNELASKNSLQNKAEDLIDQVETERDEICSLAISEEKALSENSTNFSGLENFKIAEQSAIIYYNLISGDQHMSNDTNQSDSSDMPIQELIVTDSVVRGRAAPTIPKTINGSLTCVLSDELSELNPLHSFIFQNSIPSISPYQIERKETEVLVKPSTLDISTSMTNLPCVYHFEEGNKMNDLKIFEISDELTKEECIRYLQMFDEDSNCDQSTNTHDFCNKLLQS